MSAPLRPVRFEPSPWPPRPAENSFWNLKLRRVLRFDCAVTYTDPPEPPSPPLGPPRGTNFSRRKLMAPRPPWPAATWISTSSTNMFRTAGAYPMLLRLFNRVHADNASTRTVIFELHASADLGKQRVVFAEADVQPGLEAAAALPDEDRTTGHDVAVETLHAEPLGIAVAPVARGALSLFLFTG